MEMDVKPKVQNLEGQSIEGAQTEFVTSLFDDNGESLNEKLMNAAVIQSDITQAGLRGL